MKKTNKIIMTVAIVAVLLLGLGYAAIQNITLNITGTAAADPSQANFKVMFSGTPVVSDDTYVTAAITDDTNATVNVEGLTKKGDIVTATYTVQNASEDLSADLAVSTTNSNTEYFTLSSEIDQTSLTAGEATTLTVTVELTKTPITESVSTTIGVQLEAMPVQPGEEGTSEGINGSSQTPNGGPQQNEYGFYFDRLYVTETEIEPGVREGIILHSDGSVENIACFDETTVAETGMGINEGINVCYKAFEPGYYNYPALIGSGVIVVDSESQINVDGLLYNLTNDEVRGFQFGSQYSGTIEEEGTTLNLNFVVDQNGLVTMSVMENNEVVDSSEMGTISITNNGYTLMINESEIAMVTIDGKYVIVNDSETIILKRESFCDHTYKTKVVQKLSCTSDGITELTCDKCGYSYQKTKTHGHSKDNDLDGVCDICGEKIEYVAFTITKDSYGRIGFSKNFTSFVVPEYFYDESSGIWYQTKELDSYAFGYCNKLESITLPASITTIGFDAFYYCTSLTDVNLSEGLVTIKGGAFVSCSALQTITIPDSVTLIGSNTFWMCSNLTSVYFGDNSQLETIEYEAFRDCTSLTTIKIPKTVTQINSEAFERCSSLTEIDMDENNSTYCIVDGVVYNKNITMLACYPAGKKDLVLPATVTSLSTIRYSDIVTFSVADGSKLTYISGMNECLSLTSVSLPETITSISSSAFNNCKNLKNIEFNGTIEQWNNIKFGTNWNYNVPATYVQCSDGTVPLS